MSAPLTLSRRGFFGLTAGGVLSGRMQVSVDPAMATGPLAEPSAGDQPGPASGPTLTVAGPHDSDLGVLARRLSGPLSSGLNSGVTLTLRYRGGVDGVTAANQFDARAMPDGQTALLFSGSVMLAWLAGEKRVRLDPAHLLPLMAGFGPGVLMVRGGLENAGGGQPVRLAMGPQPDAALTAMLGLDLLGIPATPVPVHGDPIEHARKGGGRTDKANAVFVHGPEAGLHAAPLLQAGFRPALSTARSGANGAAAAIPGLAAPYFLASLADQHAASDPLVRAWHAMAAATSLCALLVVPRLTPAAALGAWRQGVAASLRDGDAASGAAWETLHLAAGEAVSSTLSPMQQDESVQLALRRWLATRLNWQAG
jgi:hypothetical protein